MQEAAVIYSVEHGFPQLLPLGNIERSLSANDQGFLAGFRVLTKLKILIRNEMNNIGGQELSLPAVGRKNIWEASGMNSLCYLFIFGLFYDRNRSMEFDA